MIESIFTISSMSLFHGDFFLNGNVFANFINHFKEFRSFKAKIKQLFFSFKLNLEERYLGRKTKNKYIS